VAKNAIHLDGIKRSYLWHNFVCVKFGAFFMSYHSLINWKI